MMGLGMEGCCLGNWQVASVCCVSVWAASHHHQVHSPSFESGREEFCQSANQR